MWFCVSLEIIFVTFFFFSERHFTLKDFQSIFGVLAHICMYLEETWSIGDQMDSEGLAGVGLLVFCTIYSDHRITE